MKSREKDASPRRRLAPTSQHRVSFNLPPRRRSVIKTAHQIAVDEAGGPGVWPGALNVYEEAEAIISNRDSIVVK